MIDLLRADFQARSEPNFAGKSILSMMSLWTALRGFWYLGNADDNDDVPDLSNQGRTLFFITGAPRFITDVSFMGAIDNNGTGYYQRFDEAGTSITGTEARVATAFNGLTIGAWVHPSSTAGGIIGKWNTVGNQRSYLLDTSGGAFRFLISNAGAATDASTTSAAYDTTGYQYIVGVFSPSTYARLYVGDTDGNFTYTEDAAGVPASIFDSTALFEAFSYGTGAAINDCQISLAWLAAAQHSQTQVRMAWEQTLMAFKE